MGACPRAVDWDEDGDFDLVCGESNGLLTLFRNTGTATNPVLRSEGKIQSGGTNIDVGSLSCPVINDWDEDGRKDLVVGSDLGYVYVYLNTGTHSAPEFSDNFKIQAGGYDIKVSKNCPGIADLNEDGLKDLFMGCLSGACHYWPNHGTNEAPEFDDVYELRGYIDVLDPGPGVNNWTHMGVCDWNEDGHVDLLYPRWESEVYVHLSGAHHLACAIKPDTSPVVVPAGGGSLACKVTVTNNSYAEVTLDVWTEIVMPDGTHYGPVNMAQTDLTLLAGETKEYNLKNEVPGTFPGSNGYALAVFMGDAGFMGQPGDGYFATESFPFSKEDHLIAVPGTLPEAGGTVDLLLDASSDNALRNYIVLAGVTGTSPGFPLPGGFVTLPLNWDVFTDFVLLFINTPVFADFMGKLDASGQAAAQINAPALPPGTAGLVMYYAFALNNPFDFVSNAAEVEVVP